MFNVKGFYHKVSSSCDDDVVVCMREDEKKKRDPEVNSYTKFKSNSLHYSMLFVLYL